MERLGSVQFTGLEKRGEDRPVLCTDPGLPVASTPEQEEATMSKATNKYSREVSAPALRQVLDNQGQHSSRSQAIMSVSAKIG